MCVYMRVCKIMNICDAVCGLLVMTVMHYTSTLTLQGLNINALQHKYHRGCSLINMERLCYIHLAKNIYICSQVWQLTILTLALACTHSLPWLLLSNGWPRLFSRMTWNVFKFLIDFKCSVSAFLLICYHLGVIGVQMHYFTSGFLSFWFCLFSIICWQFL